jgi:hypothetical protein
MDISKITAQATRYRASIGANYRAVRYNGTQLNVNPTIDHMGLDLAFLATDAVRNSIEKWKCYLPKEILAESKIPATALADYDFGAWEIFEDGAWLKVFIQDVPKQQTGRWEVTFARGLVEVTMTVTYRVGSGTFTTDPATGNPIEASTAATYYAVVSQGRGRAAAVEVAGLPAGRLFLEGHFSTATGEPALMPANLQIQKPWPAVLAVGNGLEVEGTFSAALTGASPWNAAELGRGGKLQGNFISAGSGR